MSKLLRWIAVSLPLAAVGPLASVISLAHDGSHTSTVKDLSAHFVDGALVVPAKVVDCTLSGGTETKCISLTVKPAPKNMTIGPWCPRLVTDGPDKGGIWLHNNRVHDVDGAFVKDAATFFNDKTWQLFDPATGRINVTDSEVACRAAARPDVDPKYQNHCVECQVSYVTTGTTLTYLIPLKPILVKQPAQRVGRGGVGVTFNGARLDGPAPVDAILGAHTLAPFDDCGGHVNVHVGYHIHAVTAKTTTDCLKTISIEAKHTDVIGLAMDGHAIFARANKTGEEPDGLDRCGGHKDSKLGYHYHAGKPGSNAILGCHVAETGCVVDAPGKSCLHDGWIAWFKRLFD